MHVIHISRPRGCLNVVKYISTIGSIPFVPRDEVMQAKSMRMIRWKEGRREHDSLLGYIYAACRCSFRDNASKAMPEKRERGTTEAAFITH
jgi:hypothetical protein